MTKAARVMFISALAASAVAVPTSAAEAQSSGIRLGPIETVCTAVPQAEAGDVALTNVTVVNASGRGFMTAHNEDINPWAVSSVNFAQADTVPNLTATVVTDERRICVTSSRAATAHLVIDLVGIIDGNRFDAATQGGERILDTRDPEGPTSGQKVAGGASVCVDANRSGGPAVAVVNTTVVRPSADGYLTVRGESDDPITTSSHNYVADQIVANLTINRLDADQRLCATPAPWSDGHVIFDLVGWLDADAFTEPDGGPVRVMDTRLATGPTNGERVAPGATTCTGLDAPAGSIAIANVTIAQPDGPGYATAHGGTPGPVSTHNFRQGQRIANLATVTLGADSSLCVTSSPGSAIHAIADVSGVLSPDVVVPLPAGATRLLDTRGRSDLPGRYGSSTLRFGACDDLLERYKATQLRQYEGLSDDFDFSDWYDVVLPSTNGNDAVSEPTFSDTNRQDADVDEGDLMETDGRYLYTSVVSADEDGVALQVIDVAAGRAVANVDLPGIYPEMILHDDRLIITTRGDANDPFTQTTVSTFDVSDPTSPTLVDRYGVDGTRVAMRSVEDRARIVLNSYRSVGTREYGSTVTVGELRAEIENSTIEDWMPHVYDVIADGTYSNGRPGVDCNDIGVPHLADNKGITWVVEDDLGSGSGPEAASGVASSGYGTTVMATSTSLYIATGSYTRWSPGAFLGGGYATAIHLFDTSADQPISYAASGEVPGRVLNQFSLGEHDGVLRIAVTNGWWNDSSSSVFALRRVGSSFERISAVTDLAAGERIYAVRHLGATSYVVTFRETDPLFVIDFSDPHAPVLRGELKIPGFSSYLHPVGPGLLLGVGQDADLDGFRTGAQLSLFDVSDPANPRRVDTVDIGGWRTIRDHREFLFWAPTGTIAVPAASDSGAGVMAITELDGRSLSLVGTTANGDGWICDPDRTVLVGDELLVISRRSTTIVDRETLRVRATIGSCS